MKPGKTAYAGWVVFLAYVAVALVVLRVVLAHQTVGFIYDWGYGLLNYDQVKESLFSSWSSLNNGGVPLYRTTAYLNLLPILLGFLRVAPPAAYALLILLFFSLAGYSWYLLMRHRGFTQAASFLAGFFYLTSAVFIIRLEVGYLGYLASAAFLPLLLLYWDKAASETSGRVRSACLAVLVSSLAFAQSQFIAFFLLLAGADILYTALVGKGAWRRLYTAAGILAGYAAISAFWLWQSLAKVPGALGGSSFGSMAFDSRIDSLPHQVWNALLLAEHATVEGVMVAVDSGARSYVLFALLAITLVLAHRNLRARSDLLKVLIAVLVALPITFGDTAPFAHIYSLILRHVPGIGLFRESYHLEYLLLLLYAVALAAAVEVGEGLLARHRPAVRSVGWLLAVTAVITFNLPSFSGDLYGYLGSVDVPAGAAQADKALTQATPGRIYYPLGMNFWKLGSDSRIGVDYPDQLANSFANPSVDQTSSDMDTRNPSVALRNAAVSAFVNHEESFPDLIGYLGATAVVERPFLDSYYYQSVDIQNRRSSLQAIWTGTSNQSRLAAYPQLSSLVLGEGFKGYSLPAASAKGLVYLSSHPESICSFSDVTASSDGFAYRPEASLAPYLGDGCADRSLKQLEDSSSRLSFGSLSGWKHTADLGWSPGYLSFYENPSYAQSLDDFVVTRVADSFSFSLSPVAGQRLEARYYASPRGGSVSVNGTVISTRSDSEGWRYADLGDSQGATVIVKSLGGENAVGPIGYVGGSAGGVTPEKLGSGGLTYSKKSASSYAVTLSGGTAEPKLVVLSENYDPNWKLSIAGKTFSPVKVNTYANGFLVPGNLTGSATISYASQTVYTVLQWISFSCMILLALFVIRPSRSARK